MNLSQPRQRGGGRRGKRERENFAVDLLAREREAKEGLGS